MHLIYYFLDDITNVYKLQTRMCIIHYAQASKDRFPRSRKTDKIQRAVTFAKIMIMSWFQKHLTD